MLSFLNIQNCYFRVGDNLIAINNELISGKPISDVASIIRSIPRGNVQIILKTCQSDSDSSNSPYLERNKNSSNSNSSLPADDDAESNSSSLAYQPSSIGMSAFSLPLPSDKKSKVYTLPRTSILPPSSFNYKTESQIIPPDKFTSKTDKVAKYLNISRRSLRHADTGDDASDVTPLPPAPPKPVVPRNATKMMQNIKDVDEDDESDIESMFSCIPAAPPPVKNFEIPVENPVYLEVVKGFNTSNQQVKRFNDTQSYHEQNNTSLDRNKINEQLDVKKQIPDTSDDKFNDDYDDSKSDFYIPPPPPPATTGSNTDTDPIYYLLEKDENEKDIKFKKQFSVELTQHINDRKYSIGNTGMSTEININAYEDIDKFAYKNNDNVCDSVQRKEWNDKNSTLNSTITSDVDISIMPCAKTDAYSPTVDSVDNEIYYPKNSLYHQRENKKKSLFARLKSKLLLPSKSDIKEYDSPKTNKKKHKQRPLSAIDFTDDASRNILKAAISQPDLSSLCFPSGNSISSMKKCGSMDDLSFRKEFHIDTEKHNNRATVEEQHDNLKVKDGVRSIDRLRLEHSPLPRILSIRKISNAERKQKRAVSNIRNVSPPRSPPPPPPSENITQTEIPFSPYDVIQSPDITDNSLYDQIDTEISPYEHINEFLYPNDHYDYDASETSSNSQGRGSYAAEGPTALKSPDLTKDETDSSWDILDDKVQTEFDFSNTSLLTVKNKPPTPPKPRGLITRSSDISHMTIQNAMDLKQKSLSLGNLSVEPATKDTTNNFLRPSLKKRGSSLCDLNFPPPPSDNYDGNDAAANQSPNKETEDESRACKSELSEKDKSDPKLQPFVMTSDVGDLFRSLNGRKESGFGYKSENKNYEAIDANSTYCDDDGWGSEFSVNVYDEVGRSNSNASYNPQCNGTVDSNLFIPITTSKSNTMKSNGVKYRKKLKGKENEEEVEEIKSPSTPKLRVKDLKNFFNKKSGLEHKIEQPEPMSKKMRRKQVRSLPPGSFENMALDISSPVLVKRKTFSQMFSKEQLLAYGFPEDKHSNEEIIQQTILQNLKDQPLANMKRTCSDNSLVSMTRKSSGNYAIPDIFITPRGLDSENVYSELLCKSLETKKNPIPKPPRRGSLDPSLMLKNAQSYANFEQIKTNVQGASKGYQNRKQEESFNQEQNNNHVIISQKEQNESCHYYNPSWPYENLKTYQNGNIENVDEPFRPVPPIPMTEDDFYNNNTSLSQEELGQLYATIDYTQKNKTRTEHILTDGNTSYQGLNSNPSDGYSSDATVYSEPEKNNVPDEVEIIKVHKVTERRKSKRKTFTEGLFKVEVRF